MRLEGTDVRISGATRVCGIVGDPIEHTLSPAMQNAAFESAGLDYVYVPFRLPRGATGVVADAARALGFRGLNVTVPHKVDIMAYLDSVDSEAVAIGAVNTIVNDGGHLRGYNTDAWGFAEGLKARGLQVRGRDVVVLGAGGAARAVVFTLVSLGAMVAILNRDAGRAESLARDASALGGAAVAHGPLVDAVLESRLAGASLLVNTTSVGMTPLRDATPCPLRFLRPDMAVCDIVYNPRPTLLLRDAASVGAPTVDGVEMLVQQGARAFELWTGESAPVALMRDVATRELDRASH